MQDQRDNPVKSLGLQVNHLEHQKNELEHLCGQMLATLRININNRGLLATSAEGQANLEDMLRRWNVMYERSGGQPCGERLGQPLGQPCMQGSPSKPPLPSEFPEAFCNTKFNHPREYDAEVDLRRDGKHPRG